MLQPNCVNPIEPMAPLGAFNASNLAAMAAEAAKLDLELRRSKTARLWKRVPLLAATLAYCAPSSASSVLDHPFVNEHSTFLSYDIFEQPVVDVVNVGSSEGMSGLSNWLTAWTSGVRLSASVPTQLASIIDELDVLRDGWNGSGSFAPNDYVKNDLRILAQSIGLEVREPEVEVDNDGSVALRWEDGQRILALTLNGNGRVIGTMYPRTEKFPCELSVADGDNIAAFLLINEVQSSIS